MIEPLEADLRSRLGDCVYGVDGDTLEEVTLRSLTTHNWSLTVVEAGLSGELIRRLAAAKGPFIGGQVLVGLPSQDELHNLTDTYRLTHHAGIGLGVSLQPNNDAYEILIVLISPQGAENHSRRYGGPSEYAPIWAINQSLDVIRRLTHDT